MTYLIIKDNIIENVIVADEIFAQKIGAKEYYDGADIGNIYNPPQENISLNIEEYSKAISYLDLVKNKKFSYDDVNKIIQFHIFQVAKDQVEDGIMTQEEFNSIFGKNI